MDYIAVLSYEHLDNGLFLTSFARKLARKKKRGIILHESSEYTERIIQTGVMRDEATIRCLKELNHRLVALFADEGISTIALNGHQKNLFQVETNKKRIDVNFSILDNFPPEPVILVSALGVTKAERNTEPISISEAASSIQKYYNLSLIDLFSTKENSEIIVDDLPLTIIPSECDTEFLKQNIPSSFHNFESQVRLQSPSTF